MTIQEIESRIDSANVEELKMLCIEFKRLLSGMQKVNDEYVHFLQEYISDIDDVGATDPMTLKENKRTMIWLTETYRSIQKRLEPKEH